MAGDVKEIATAEDQGKDQHMQRERAREVGAQVVAEDVVVAVEIGMRRYGILLLLQRLGDDADVGDARLFDGVHDGGEGSEGNLFVSAKIDDPLGGWPGAYTLQAGGQIIDVDRLVLQEDVLVFIDGDDHALFGQLIDGAGLGDRHFDAGLKDGRGEHEDEQQHQHDVDEGRDVDLGECGLGAGLSTTAGGEGHGLEGPPTRLVRSGRGCRGEHGCVFDGVEELAAEVVHAGAELAQAGGELVVADDGRDGYDEAGGGGDEGFGDAWSYGAQGGGSGCSQAVEGVDDAHDGAEETDEGRDGGDGGEPGHAALHGGESFAGGGLGGTFERDGIAGQAAATGLALVFVVDLVEDRDQGAGLELVRDGGELAESARFAEGADEALSLHRSFPEAGPLGEHDGPGEDAGEEKHDQYGEGYRAAVVNHLCEGAGVRRDRRCRGRIFLKEQSKS